MTGPRAPRRSSVWATEAARCCSRGELRDVPPGAGWSRIAAISGLRWSASRAWPATKAVCLQQRDRVQRVSVKAESNQAGHEQRGSGQDQAARKHYWSLWFISDTQDDNR